MIVETLYHCENTNNKVIIPLDPQWQTLGLQISGGLDSALLTHLTAKTILEKGFDISIMPISCDVGNKPPYLPTARKVIGILKDLHPKVKWQKSYEYRIKLRESKNPLKLYAATNHMQALFNLKLIDYEYNGITLNPPAEVRRHFTNDQYREVVRDKPSSIYISERSARPLAFCDKQGVVELYKIHGIFDSIFPKTLSCDVNIEHVVDGKIPCRACWWCDERSWGLESNGEDPLL